LTGVNGTMDNGEEFSESLRPTRAFFTRERGNRARTGSSKPQTNRAWRGLCAATTDIPRTLLAYIRSCGIFTYRHPRRLGGDARRLL